MERLLGEDGVGVPVSLNRHRGCPRVWHQPEGRWVRAHGPLRDDPHHEGDQDTRLAIMWTTTVIRAMSLTATMSPKPTVLMIVMEK